MKKVRRWTTVFFLVTLLFILSSPVGSLEAGSQSLAELKETADSVKEFAKKLPERIRMGFSSSVSNMISLADRWARVEGVIQEITADNDVSATRPPKISSDVRLGQEQAVVVSTKPVSDPTKDFVNSRLGGFTQNQTSTAWCGKNVVVGFNDSGSILESYSDDVGQSFAGVARSTDKGTTFTDLGYLIPNADETDRIWGHAVVKCTNANTFYFASVMSRNHASGTADDTRDIGISKSIDGGATWGDARSAASKPAATHLLDRPWLAIDPTSANRLHITYTDIDIEALSGTATTCPADSIRTAIELVKSTNAGATWSKPLVIAQACAGSDSSARVDGSQVVVGPAGEIYVAWEAFADDYVTREIVLRKSANPGSSFGTPVKVSNVTPVGSYDSLQGMIQAREFPALGVDTTPGSQNVYVAWNDGRNLNTTEAISKDYKYHYADILFSSSTDGGATWLATPVRVNQNSEIVKSQGSDQFFPALAVDSAGTIGVCFYDRRADTTNLFIERYCAYSLDVGTTWSEVKISRAKSAPLHDQDILATSLSIGEYDSLSTDKLKFNKGFIGSYADSSERANWDVKAGRFSF